MAISSVHLPAAPASWHAELTLKFEARGNRTVLGACQRKGPLTFQRPFYPEGDVCHLYLLHPPGGVAGGDALAVRCDVDSGARAVITTPGATKFYTSNGPDASQTQTLTVADDALLEWLPQENIFFEGARVRCQTDIRLTKSAALAYWEVHCFGRPANGIEFDAGDLDSRLSLSRGERLILVERLLVDPASRLEAAGLRGLPICATAIFGPAPEYTLDKVQPICDAASTGGLTGVTQIEDFIIVRHLGASSAFARDLFAQVWDCLRPDISGLAPCQPRIWRT